MLAKGPLNSVSVLSQSFVGYSTSFKHVLYVYCENFHFNCRRWACHQGMGCWCFRYIPVCNAHIVIICCQKLMMNSIDYQACESATRGDSSFHHLWGVHFILTYVLHYGDNPAGKIPRNSWLVFDVELVDVN
ncbi:hypothetical protein BHE74_00038862 [Ensete ventricosum]|nr:hypothetical protein GW17_00037782 [Ensete ventricosum]RWW54552.1 hypothetical protein BHE74_00038862 [Ensete ventricosum]